MKIYLMKQEALDQVKLNLDAYYMNYFNEPDNSWIYDLFEDDPFEELIEIDDFELCDLDSGLSIGEIECENCKIVYKHLSFLTPSQATDERLWAGLCHTVFYKYLRRRWKYDIKAPKGKNESVNEIRTRFFVPSNKGTRSSLYRNTLSKCWWIGYLTYRKGREFELLDYLGGDNLSTKIFTIFGNRFSANPTILEGIILGIKTVMDMDDSVSYRKDIASAMTHLNNIASVTVLDYLSTEEISNIIVDYVIKNYGEWS